MRPIDINLASRPVHNNFVFYLGYTLALLVLVAFTTYNVKTMTEHSERVAELDAGLAEGRAQLAELEGEARRLRKEITARDLNELSSRIAAANTILAERKFSWTRMLNALEEVQPYKVRLLELRPVIAPGGVLIQTRGMSKDLENFWQLQQRLQEHPMFRRVYPNNYSQGAGDVLFSLSFNYFENPADAPGEGEEAPVTPQTVAAGGKVGPAAGESARPAAKRTDEEPAEEQPAPPPVEAGDDEAAADGNGGKEQ